MQFSTKLQVMLMLEIKLIILTGMCIIIHSPFDNKVNHLNEIQVAHPRMLEADSDKDVEQIDDMERGIKRIKKPYVQGDGKVENIERFLWELLS